MTIHSRDPAYAGYASAGYSRAGVYTSRWDSLINRNAKDLTRRIYVAGDPDSTTGIRVPDYSDTESIRGVLVERGGSMPAFAAGVVCQQDAVVFTLDPLMPKDQIVDGGIYYEVFGKPEEHLDPDVGGFAFRIAQLHRLFLFKEED